MASISRKSLTKGLVQVYTGLGKGKTTSALGQALRAIGHGLRVYMGCFFKKRPVGELIAAKKYLQNNLTIEQFGPSRFIQKGEQTEEDKRIIDKAFQRARKVVLSGKFDIVILDEINRAVDLKLIDLEAVLELVREKPPYVELILTGRGAHPEIVKIADLVTEMLAIKHPLSEGIAARKGIEY
ncbi:MAG: cob(I)yrinic acid a,c-diamide adenosyltransferase [Promethearchaeota archaeon]